MYLLLPAVGPTQRAAAARSQSVGFLLTPRAAGTKYKESIRVYGVDNECYTLGERFQFDRYLALLWRLRSYPGHCLFAACPDMVGDAEETARRWRQYAPVMRAIGLPVAYVLQDGCERLPRGDYEAVFVGGSDEYKLGPVAARLVTEAKRAGLHVHVGRVNSCSRMRWAFELGADSIDGTKWAIDPTAQLPWALSELQRQQQQPRLLALA